MKYYCPNCNEIYEKEGKYCLKCGTALVSRTEAVIEGRKSSGKWRTIGIPILLLIALVIAGGLFLFNYFSPAERVNRLVISGNWDAAKEIYVDIIQGDNEAEKNVEKTLMEILEQVKIDYINQVIEYTAVVDVLESIEEMDPEVLLYAEVEVYVEQLKKSRDAYASGESFLVTENYIDAVYYYEQVWKEDANYTDAQSKIKSSKEQYKANVLTKAEEYKAAENYYDAIHLMQNAFAWLGDDSELETLIAQYQKEEVTKKLLAYEQSGDFLGGIHYGRENTEIVTADPELQSKLDSYEKQYRMSLISQAKNIYAEQGYASAAAVIDGGLETLTGDEQLLAEKANYIALYRGDILVQAENVFNDQGYEAAISVINTGLKVLTGDTELLAAKENYESYIPVLLFDMVMLSGDEFFYSVSEGTDNVGYTYSNAYALGIRDGKQCTYILEGKYSRLEGKLALSSQDKNASVESGFAFYGDGVLLGYSPMLKQGVRPQSFSIDVTGVTELTVECVGGTFYGTIQLYTEGFYLFK